MRANNMIRHLLCLFCLTVLSQQVHCIKVQVEQGWLEGEKLQLVTKDGEYFSFKGIPYATPPLGKLRFKPPQPPKPWKGIRDATKHGAICIQSDIYSNKFVPQSREDCLFINVYTPDLTPKKPLPVMVFIHGGGFESDSGNVANYGPDFLVNDGVILVTFNYRLEVLGFLSLENEDVPGNAGLKDQVAALKWVKKNISKFGGDPENITIFGQSAGGVAAVLHIVSPLSKGLFKRAISMSGVPSCDWVYAYQPRRRAFVLGKQLGLDTNDPKELLEFFQNIPADKLSGVRPNVLASENITDIEIKMFHFTPLVETNFNQEHFITERPINLLIEDKLSQVDLMIGHTSEEEIVDLVSFEDRILKTYPYYKELLVPRKILISNSPDKILELADLIMNHYFGNKFISKDTFKELLAYLNDSTYNYDIYRYIKYFYQSLKKNIYVYRFSAVSERNIFGKMGQKYNLTGAAHLDDTLYIFDPKHAKLDIDKNSKAYKIIEQTTKLFTNFAKYGNPTPDASLGVTWSAYDNVTESFLDIGEKLTPGRALDAEAAKFWKTIFDKAGLLSQSTPGVKVQVEQGWLEGEKLQLVTKDGEYYSFKGIPYATPPLGKLRFKSPEPPKSWKGTRDATKHGSICVQFDTKSNKVVPGSNEDCLFLNVYTPVLNPKEPLPVMFFIHGGRYETDSGNVDNYGPDFLVKHGVILVTINYRLEVLGFLSLDTDSVPGNAGLKDQVAALKWVKKNISQFGGDPDNITVFGQSAGGVATILFMVSPLAKGLFKRAIAMSGVPSCDWTLSYQHTRRAFVLGKQLGFNTYDPKELFEFLQNVPAYKLAGVRPDVLASENITDIDLKMNHLTPVLEKNFNQEHFLTEDPNNIIRRGELSQVDLMIGHTSEEGIGIIIPLLDRIMKTYPYYKELLVPTKILRVRTSDRILDLADLIMKQYFGKKIISKDTLKELLAYINDSTFNYDIYRYIKLLYQGLRRKMYVYRFSAVSSRNIYGELGKKYDLIGASHLDDTAYIFDPKSAKLKIDKNSKAYKIIEQTTKLYTNFAKYGNPTPDTSLGEIWPAYDNVTESFLDIGEKLTPGRALDAGAAKFWKTIFDKAELQFEF